MAEVFNTLTKRQERVLEALIERGEWFRGCDNWNVESHSETLKVFKTKRMQLFIEKVEENAWGNRVVYKPVVEKILKSPVISSNLKKKLLSKHKR